MKYFESQGWLCILINETVMHKFYKYLLLLVVFFKQIDGLESCCKSQLKLNLFNKRVSRIDPFITRSCLTQP